MRVFLTFIVFIVCSVRKSDADSTAIFNISTTTKDDSKYAYCESEPEKITVEDGASVRISSSNFYSIKRSNCSIPGLSTHPHTARDNDQNTDSWFLLQNVSTEMSGRWSCVLKYGDQGSPILPNDDGFTTVHCHIHVTVTKRITPGGVEGGRSAGNDGISNTNIIIIVGVIVTLIVLGQSIGLLYIKSRAHRRNRLDSLITQDRHFNRNDEVRYSAPPSRRNTKNNRAAADTDSHIYEMVGINALYKESSELDIKNRPALPLPGDSTQPPPVPIDTLPRTPKSKASSSSSSLNSVSRSPAAKPVKKELPPTPVSTLNKAPCRPPKPADVDTPTGSLPRPPKPQSLQKHMPGASLPRPPKPGAPLARPPKPGNSMPKMPPTDPGILELKKALERRNVKNAASPTPSQQSTLEMEKTQKRTEPPPTLAKPGKPPVGIVNPSVKFVLPKIEASLKPPGKSKPEAVLPRSEPVTGGSGQQPIKPGVSTARRPNPEPSSSAATAPLIPPQIQAMPRPVSPIPTEEDESHYSDDEEWTYEQLEKYNIYNV